MRQGRRLLKRWIVIVFTTIAMIALVVACGSVDTELQSGAMEVATEVELYASPEATPPGSPEGLCGFVELGSSEAIGSAAIQPSLAAEPGKPAFTEDDARAYVAANPPDFWDSDTPPPVVKRVEFMSACDVAIKVNHPVYKPDETLVALVTLTGTWKPRLPPGVKPSGPPIPNTVAYLIFDATTGNLIGRTSGVENP